MKTYQYKQELIVAINNSLNQYLTEFEEISEDLKDHKVATVDKTPAQNLSYQLGWVNLLLEWESKELAGFPVSMPKEGYKWNNLASLYQNFYQTHAQHSLKENTQLLSKQVKEVTDWIENLTDEELFEINQRKWATTPANWPLYKWIHINTVAPFTNFRVQIRKWKKLSINTEPTKKP